MPSNHPQLDLIGVQQKNCAQNTHAARCTLARGNWARRRPGLSRGSCTSSECLSSLLSLSRKEKYSLVQIFTVLENFFFLPYHKNRRELRWSSSTRASDSIRAWWWIWLLETDFKELYEDVSQYEKVYKNKNTLFTDRRKQQIILYE